MKSLNLGGPAKLFISLLLVLAGYLIASRITTERGDLETKPAEEPEQEYIAEKETGLVTIECWLADLGISDIDLGSGPLEFEVEVGTNCSDLKKQRIADEEVEREKRNQEYHDRYEFNMHYLKEVN